MYCTTIIEFYRKVQRCPSRDPKISRSSLFASLSSSTLSPFSQEKNNPVLQNWPPSISQEINRKVVYFSHGFQLDNLYPIRQSSISNVKKVSHKVWTWVSAGIRKTNFPDFCQIFELAIKRTLWKSIWKMWTIFWSYLRDHKIGSTVKKACL